MEPQSANTQQPQPLTITEVAQYLRINHNTVRDMVKAGRIRAVKAGREWRITWKSIERYLEGE